MRTIRVPVVPRTLRWTAVALVAGFIFYTSIVTTPPTNPVVPSPPDLIPLDKWRHFLAYGGLAGSLSYATLDWDAPILHVALFVLGTTVLYGVGIEFWQSMIPRRYFSVGDAYANLLRESVRGAGARPPRPAGPRRDSGSSVLRGGM